MGASHIMLYGLGTLTSMLISIVLLVSVHGMIGALTSSMLGYEWNVAKSYDAYVQSR